jgi:hypothetical protein
MCRVLLHFGTDGQQGPMRVPARSGVGQVPLGLKVCVAGVSYPAVAYVGWTFVACFVCFPQYACHHFSLFFPGVSRVN